MSFDFTPRHEHLIGVDSDGCAFDTMEVKHKECFIPNIIEYYHLAAVSKYAREAAEFVNLYSKWRGVNRFPALLRTMDLLVERDEVRKRGVKIPTLPSVRRWTETETKLANPALESAVKSSGDAELAHCLAWSKAVNQTVERVVHDVPPFPLVRESLQKVQPAADVLVVSATPGEALVREWREHDLEKYTVGICGQEVGTKAQMLGLAKKYAPGKTLMVGDAPGDRDAATKNGALFYPINPGAEDESWQRFFEEAVDRFLSGTYAGAYERQLIEEFERRLPATPPWK